MIHRVLPFPAYTGWYFIFLKQKHSTAHALSGKQKNLLQAPATAETQHIKDHAGRGGEREKERKGERETGRARGGGSGRERRGRERGRQRGRGQHTHLKANTGARVWYVCMYAHGMYTHMHVYTHACIHTCMYACTRVGSLGLCVCCVRVWTIFFLSFARLRAPTPHCLCLRRCLCLSPSASPHWLWLCLCLSP